MNNILKFFEIRLQSLMDTKGLKVGQLALITSVSSTMASMWYHGHEIPPLDIMNIIALWLGARIDEVWIFKADCFKEIIELAKLHQRQAVLEKELAGKLNGIHES